MQKTRRSGSIAGPQAVSEMTTAGHDKCGHKPRRHRKYSDDPKLKVAEQAARRAQWTDPSPVAPWDWRKGRRE